MSHDLFIPNDSTTNVEVSTGNGFQSIASVDVRTKYANYQVGSRQSISGATETWSTLRTRPAFEVAMLRYDGGELQLQLMSKRRTVDDPWKTKVPGGYLWGEFHEYAPKKVLGDTGLRFDPRATTELPGVIGHAEIITPIRLYYTFVWKREGQPREGFRVFEVSLKKAVDMACLNDVENDSSFHLIMKVQRLHANRML